MKWKGEKITFNKVESFLKGNYLSFYNKLVGLEVHIQEQVSYRMWLCRDTCMVKKECLKCLCDVPERMFIDKKYEQRRCVFPDLMNSRDWELYKSRNNINIKEITEHYDSRN